MSSASHKFQHKMRPEENEIIKKIFGDSLPPPPSGPPSPAPPRPKAKPKRKKKPVKKDEMHPPPPDRPIAYSASYQPTYVYPVATPDQQPLPMATTGSLPTIETLSQHHYTATIPYAEPNYPTQTAINYYVDSQQLPQETSYLQQALTDPDFRLDYSSPALREALFRTGDGPTPAGYQSLPVSTMMNPPQEPSTCNIARFPPLRVSETMMTPPQEPSSSGMVKYEWSQPSSWPVASTNDSAPPFRYPPLSLPPRSNSGMNLPLYQEEQLPMEPVSMPLQVSNPPDVTELPEVTKSPEVTMSPQVSMPIEIPQKTSLSPEVSMPPQVLKPIETSKSPGVSKSPEVPASIDVSKPIKPSKECLLPRLSSVIGNCPEMTKLLTQISRGKPPLPRVEPDVDSIDASLSLEERCKLWGAHLAATFKDTKFNNPKAFGAENVAVSQEDLFLREQVSLIQNVSNRPEKSNADVTGDDQAPTSSAAAISTPGARVPVRTSAGTAIDARISGASSNGSGIVVKEKTPFLYSLKDFPFLSLILNQQSAEKKRGPVKANLHLVKRRHLVKKSSKPKKPKQPRFRVDKTDLRTQTLKRMTGPKPGAILKVPKVKKRLPLPKSPLVTNGAVSSSKGTVSDPIVIEEESPAVSSAQLQYPVAVSNPYAAIISVQNIAVTSSEPPAVTNSCIPQYVTVPDKSYQPAVRNNNYQTSVVEKSVQQPPKAKNSKRKRATANISDQPAVTENNKKVKVDSSSYHRSPSKNTVSYQTVENNVYQQQGVSNNNYLVPVTENKCYHFSTVENTSFHQSKVDIYQPSVVENKNNLYPSVNTSSNSYLPSITTVTRGTPFTHPSGFYCGPIGNSNVEQSSFDRIPMMNSPNYGASPAFYAADGSGDHAASYPSTSVANYETVEYSQEPIDPESAFGDQGFGNNIEDLFHWTSAPLPVLSCSEWDFSG